MCGIISYIGDKEIVPLLIKGLKILEYRGYDSAGLCINNGQELKVIKRSGRISELEKSDDLENLKGDVGIAHTRWATHGVPNEINAHPHLDCKKEIAIVHNGIIENYVGLREILKKKGHSFISNTDSEVIAHLIEDFYQGDLTEATINALRCVDGTFGLAVMKKNENKIVAARRGSPLIVGVGDNEMFVCSDAAGILEHTKKVIYLDDNEVATITKEDYNIRDVYGNGIDKKVHEIKWDIGQIEKKGFKHFMLKEIFEQPEALENTLRGRIKDENIKLSLNLDTRSIKRIIFIACGTSWHSALIGKYIIEKINRIPVEVDYASEFRYRNPIVQEYDLVIAISQSGETADTLAAINEAKSKKAKTLGIVNVVGSTISREVDSGIYLHSGPEIGVASTKAFTGQVLAILLFSLYIEQEKGNKIDHSLIEEISRLPEKARMIFNDSEKIRKIADDLKESKAFLFLGRGINFPVALEGALKLKEISYIHAEGYPTAEMKHGPIALIENGFPVIFVLNKDNLTKKCLSNIEEIKSRGGKIIIVTNDRELEEVSDEIIYVPFTKEELSPILNVIPLQLLSYYIADLKGIDPDKPRNLAKSVTVE
ncbi:MAG: glutamine--fructose-6-phosphate transaminase (isomerizing) [Candidatus Nanoarchaeia archaeon]|nr:glutamine--fructose-6-phosphate transaminase (isomerizing) [Candidatus Nanoarchaeia archaeon]